ncbi:hypothetical protein [Parabacteroides distasonis]|uniref:Uncharacterized protein n=1 Tax=Parabacteroides distasonis TaxID=823 RepID=A0A6I2NZB0_PARDI|nr:hypothetical protein [Parabacteroides distasonis]MRY85399.1 hypothetical protein [Parabacteroides distasonis]MRZ06527.1 hypothetical protein [Parabacteroides distasonis]
MQDNPFDNHIFFYQTMPTGVEISPEAPERAATAVGIPPKALGGMPTGVGIVSEAFR